ncbi:MAG: hypothetical protein WCR85_00110 [Sphaerochaeta sp.]
MSDIQTPEPSPDLFDEMPPMVPQDATVDGESLKAEIIIVGAEECPNCGAVKKLFEEELEAGGVRYVDIYSEEGQKLDDLFDRITAVPFIALHNQETQEYTECDLKPIGEEMSKAEWTIICNQEDPEKTRQMVQENRA